MKYLVKLEAEEVVEADSEEDAIGQFYTDIEESNQTLETFTGESTTAVEVCPNCEIPLESKMIDVDGTNLEEHKVCPRCGYGTPALR